MTQVLRSVILLLAGTICLLPQRVWSLNLADVPCGKPELTKTVHSSINNHLTRINDGEEARQREFPWMVSLQYKWGEHFCGGFLINKRYVLTAAHCFHNVYGDVKQEYIQAVLGVHAISSRKVYSSSTNTQILDLESITVHPEFDLGDYSNDIAIIRLDQDAEWSSNIRPACLSDPSFVPEGLTGVVAGWGGSQDMLREPLSTVLRKANIPIIQNFQCKNWFMDSGINWIPKDSHLCAGYLEGGKDSCRGDSGGPLMVTHSSGRKLRGGDGGTVVVGIVSAGKGCGRPMLPGVYTRLSSYISWIKDNMGN